MNNRQKILGKLILRITCADSVGLLNALNDERIRLHNVTYLGDLDLQISVSRYDYPRISVIAEKHGANVKIVRSRGLYPIARTLRKRPVLLGFFVLLFCISLFLPTRILFVTVEGNSTVPTKLIIEAAEQSGIRFGVSRRKIRSEVMKNALLQQIPQLQWAGVNTSGCIAKISVREKTQSDEVQTAKNEVCSIVASRDGIIRNTIVYQGNALCTVGQAVKEGQTLVSGYTDCGLITKAIRADAEITALTFRQIIAVSPNPSVVRTDVSSHKTRYSLRIGKKLIKFYKDSGNLDDSCGKIYSEEYVYLPGGFRLPIALVKEELTFYEQIEEASAVADEPVWMEEFVKSHLQNVMIAGEIISGQTQTEATADAVYFYGKYVCTEMIGQVKYEQTILRDEKND